MGAFGTFRAFFLGHYRGERKLSTVVDLGDFHLDLLAHGNDVINVVHALAVGQLAELGDVQEAVLARGQRYEGTEGGGLDDRTR